MMKNEVILELLQTHLHLRIETTETRDMDSLDFHNVEIWRFVNLVQAAYEKGLDQGYEDGMEAAQEMNALYARECGE
jgi:hypothetical protein